MVPELTSDEDLGDLAAALLKNETAFIGIGNEVNEEQYQKLLVCTEGNGFYCSTGNLSDTMDLINNYMVDTVQVKDYTLGDMITKDVTISYNGIFSDEDGDCIYAQNWEYEYNPNIFGENVGETSHIVKNGNEPITQFEDTGAYAIRLTVRDNPVSANDLFDTEEHDKLVVVETRPVAQVDVIVRKNSKDKTICNTNVTYHSYDEDHPSDGKGGIREEYFYYKNVKDGSWQEGRLPNVLTVGETYLVMYQVKDVEGTLSFPAVSVVKTSDLLSYSQVEDLSNPEVCLVPEKYEIAVGEKIMVEGYALDDCGINTFEMYEDGQKVLSSFGRIYVTGRKKGTIVIKGIAKDIRNKKSEKEITIQVYDNRDTVAPTAEITSPLGGCDLDFDKVQIVGTAKDETSFKGYTLAYKLEQEEEYHIFKESDTEVTNGLLGELDISMFPQGTYEILLTVEDTEGNQSYFRILLYVETGISNQYELISEITEISYNPTVKQVNIYGTVRGDEQFEKYTLSLKKGTVGEEMIIAEGTQTKENERIATINSENLDTGTYHLVLAAHDKEGNVSSSCGSFNYKKGEDRTELDADVNAPTAQITKVALGENQANVNVSATVKDDKELKGYTLEYASLSVSKNSVSDNTLEETDTKNTKSVEQLTQEDYILLASGENPIEDTMIGTIPVSDLTPGSYALRLKAWDSFGNTCINTTSFIYTKGSGVTTVPGNEIEAPTTVKKEFKITLSKSVAEKGSYIEALVTLPNGVTEQDLEIQLNGETLSKRTKRAAFVATQIGENRVTAILTKDEECQTVSANCLVFNAEDKEAPVADITTPEPSAVVTKPVDIIGSAYDEEELYFYKLEYRLEGEKEYTLISEGTEPKKEEVLGHFDTTILANGKYEIRLWVQDNGGNIVKVTNQILVDGNLKVGAMNLGFTDITSQMGATTVNVNRMYNSLNKKSGDFGYGWTLSMQDMELYESNSIESGYICQQCVRADEGNYRPGAFCHGKRTKMPKAMKFINISLKNG